MTPHADADPVGEGARKDTGGDGVGGCFWLLVDQRAAGLCRRYIGKRT